MKTLPQNASNYGVRYIDTEDSPIVGRKYSNAVETKNPAVKVIGSILLKVVKEGWKSIDPNGVERDLVVATVSLPVFSGEFGNFIASNVRFRSPDSGRIVTIQLANAQRRFLLELWNKLPVTENTVASANSVSVEKVETAETTEEGLI